MKTMNKTMLWTLLVTSLCGLGALAALAGAPDKTTTERHRIKIVDDAAGRIDLELEDLAVGESQSFTTDSGKAGTVTRTETGYDLDVDGKKIKLNLDGDGEGSMHMRIKNKGGEDREVIVRGGSGEPGGGHRERNIVIVTAGDDDAQPGTKKVKKRVIVHGGDAEGEDVQMRVLDGDSGDAIIEQLGDEDSKVIVIRKHKEGAGNEEHEIEIRVEDADDDDDGASR